MTITIKKTGKTSPLAGIPNPGQIAGKIKILMDPNESYQDRKDAAAWLRGAWTITRKNPSEKYQKAANYINELLREHRYAEDTTGD